jgi:DNA polymerase-3 subunit beta
MRATTQRVALLETLGKVKSAVSGKSVLPICASILIRAGSGQIWLTATNLEVALSASCKATVGRQGAVAIPAFLLEAFLKTAKAEKVILSLASPNSLKIEAGAVTTLKGFEAKDFPPVPGVKGAPTVVVGLASALKEISYAMAKEDSRPVLAGVCFTPQDGKIALAAADGFRLAATTVNAKGNLERMIVPSKAICLIQKLMPGKVSIHKGDGDNVAFIGDGLMLTTHAVQGTYPNYEQIIPKNGLPLTLECQALRDALDVVSVTLGDNNIVRLEKKGTNLIVSTKDEEKGETEAKVPAKGKGKIAFQMNYLKESLARLDGRISLRITDPSTPGVVKQGKTIHVLMPMFVQW